MLDKDPTLSVEAVSNARLKQAAAFIDTALKPNIQKGEEITQERFNNLLADFQQSNIELGADFEIGHVWAVALDRFADDAYAARNNMEWPVGAEVDYEVFEVVNQFGFNELGYYLMERLGTATY